MRRSTSTDDLDRLIEFYETVFEATVVADLTEGGLRHAFIGLGGGFVLHPFELPERAGAPAAGTMFRRGHLDHVALKADDPLTFETLRDRLVARGASDGVVTDFGLVRTITYVDPDGSEGEVAQWAEGELRSFDERVHEAYAR